MEYKGIKFNIVILIIIIMIGVFFGGQYLYKIYNIDQPVKKEILEIEGIDNVSIVEKNGQIDILVSLKSGIDFFQVYHKIEEIMIEKLGEQKGIIKVDNEKSKELEEEYYKLHFAIYEGISTREFVKMKESIDQIVNKINLDNYKLWIDNQAVYIQLDNNNNSLYKRIPYNRDIIVRTEGGVKSG